MQCVVLCKKPNLCKGGTAFQILPISPELPCSTYLCFSQCLSFYSGKPIYLHQSSLPTFLIPPLVSDLISPPLNWIVCLTHKVPSYLCISPIGWPLCMPSHNSNQESQGVLPKWRTGEGTKVVVGHRQRNAQ